MLAYKDLARCAERANKADLITREASFWKYRLMKGLRESRHHSFHSLVDGPNELAGFFKFSVDA